MLKITNEPTLKKKQKDILQVQGRINSKVQGIYASKSKLILNV